MPLKMHLQFHEHHLYLKDDFKILLAVNEDICSLHIVHYVTHSNNKAKQFNSKNIKITFFRLEPCQFKFRTKGQTLNGSDILFLKCNNLINPFTYFKEDMFNRGQNRSKYVTPLLQNFILKNMRERYHHFFYGFPM